MSNHVLLLPHERTRAGDIQRQLHRVNFPILEYDWRRAE